MTPPISRREARRSALTLLYQWDVTERALGELYEGEIDTYAQGVTEAIVRDAEELDRRITEAAAESGWTADRLAETEGGSPDRALEILGELSELAKSVEEELERAKRSAEADAEKP